MNALACALVYLPALALAWALPVAPGLSLAVQSATFVLAYFVLAFLMGVLSRDDLAYLGDWALLRPLRAGASGT